VSFVRPQARRIELVIGLNPFHVMEVTGAARDLNYAYYNGGNASPELIGCSGSLKLNGNYGKK
jgi:hypothetical protein